MALLLSPESRWKRRCERLQWAGCRGIGRSVWGPWRELSLALVWEGIDVEPHICPTLEAGKKGL